MASEATRRLIALLVVVAAMGAQSLVTERVGLEQSSKQSDQAYDLGPRLLALDLLAPVSPSD